MSVNGKILTTNYAQEKSKPEGLQGRKTRFVISYLNTNILLPVSFPNNKKQWHKTQKGLKHL